MLRIFPRYLLRQWLVPFFGALLLYGGLILAWELILLSRQIFEMGAPFQWMVPYLLTVVPEVLNMVLPMAAVLGGLLGSQHLSEGSETVAAQGLGVGMTPLLRSWGGLALGILILSSLNSNFLVPKVNQFRNTIHVKMTEAAQTRFLRPGGAPHFPPQNPDHALWIDANGEIHWMEASPKVVQHLVARSIEWSKAEDGSQSTLHLELRDLSGSLVQRENGNIAQITQKKLDLGIQVPPPSGSLLAPTQVMYLSTSELMKKATPEARLELTRRFSLPIAACALLLLGIALGLGHPRFQRGGAMLKSLGVILVYYILMKTFENMLLTGKPQIIYPLLAMPWCFLAWGFFLLWKRLHPHRSAPSFFSRVLKPLKRLSVWLKTRSLPWLESLQRHFPHPVAWLGRRWRKVHQGGTLARWTRGLWWKNWGITLGTFLALSLLLDFANLAGDLAKNKVSILVFFHYWFWNLPPFLAVVLPITFLLAGALSISQAALSREWVALRAGGVSFLQWSLTGARAWGGVLLLTLSLQAFVAPIANPIADSLYRNITNKPPRPTSRPWLYLGGTGVLWRLEGDTRWGFPLKSVGSAPILLHWKRDDVASTALPWYGLQWQGGPEAHRLFPEASLRQRAQAEDATTAELVQWQRWAPDPERSSMLWSRLLNWLAGPCLLFAILPHVFPRPRGGRGRVLGVALIAGLLFMGTQALFGGAARAGEIPGFWGVLAPLMGLAGFGFLGLPRLKT